MMQHDTCHVCDEMLVVGLGLGRRRDGSGTEGRMSHNISDGHVLTDDGGLGRLSMHLNEDVEDEALADVIASAMMIDEGDDFNDNRLWEERVGVYMDWRIKCWWMLRA